MKRSLPSFIDDNNLLFKEVFVNSASIAANGGRVLDTSGNLVVNGGLQYTSAANNGIIFPNTVNLLGGRSKGTVTVRFKTAAIYRAKGYELFYNWNFANSSWWFDIYGFDGAIGVQFGITVVPNVNVAILEIDNLGLSAEVTIALAYDGTRPPAERIAPFVNGEEASNHYTVTTYYTDWDYVYPPAQLLNTTNPTAVGCCSGGFIETNYAAHHGDGDITKSMIIREVAAYKNAFTADEARLHYLQRVF